MVRASHDHHASGPWSLKDRTDSVGNTGTRARTVSTRILGIGIVLAGVLVLAVGLIMGLEFPNYVHEQNKEKQCVVYTGHDKFKSWSEGSQWYRKVYAHYWTLLNANDFLYKGQMPQFVQKGPYVYQETEIKYNVNFAATEVSYHQLRHHVFDRTATETACSSCTEHDVLTILSPWYLQTVGHHGGEDAVSWTHIPTYMNFYLLAAGFAHKHEGENAFSQNISLFGNFISKSTIFVTEPLANFSFGTWLHLSTNNYRTPIQSSRQGQDFTLSEVKAIYKVLTNLTLLGGQALQQPDKSLQQKCKQWARELCSSVQPFLKLTLGIHECGVIYILSNCQAYLSSYALNMLQEVLCPSADINACLNLTALSTDLLLTYENAIFDFIQHLSSLVLDHFLAAKDLSLVVSRNQSQLALGYDISGDQVFQAGRQTGLLQSSWVGDTIQTRMSWTVYTCLEKRNMNNNMKVKEYNHSWSSPVGLLRGLHKVSLSSYTDYVPPCPDLATCRTCSTPSSTLSFFLEDLLRAASFLLNSSTSHGGVKVFKYELHPNTFAKSKMLAVDGGFQNMTSVTGYLSWASFPQMFQGNVEYFSLSKVLPVTDSYVLVEPVTGRVWERNIKLQWNLGITHESGHVLGRNISVIDLPLPVLTTERVATITSQEIQAYKHLITRLMAVSCGGIIGFSVIAFVIIVVGLVVCVYPFKPNRILPMIDDLSSVPNGRHL